MNHKEKPVQVPVTGGCTPAERWALAGLLVLSLMLRLLYMGRADLWQDEIGFLNISQPSASPWTVFLAYWNHCVSIAQLPLAGVLQNLYIHLLGQKMVSNYFWLRFPEAVLGTLSVLGVFKLADLVADRTAAWMAGFFMAVFLYPIYYSRELYCYAHVLCFSSFGLYFWVRSLSFSSWKNWLPAWFFLAALGLSHFAGSFLIAATGTVAGIWWLFYLFVQKDPVRARTAFFAALMCAAAMLPVLPYWIRIFTNANPHMASHSLLPLSAILNDGVVKMFMGEQTVMAALSWLFFVLGLIWLSVRFKKMPAMVSLAGVMLLTMVLLTVVTKNSQYLSARYFSPVAAPAYVVFALGILALPRWLIKKERVGIWIALTCGGVLIAIHALFYLPPYYRLTAKSVDFGIVAQWLNKNLQPGQPYLMESAYELRWVGGYYKTPGLIGATPYVHGNGPEEARRLHESQQQFMQRFPEAPFVESAHHNWEKPEGVWPWPHQFHARRIQLRNEPLRALVRLGIYPGLPHEAVTDYSYVTDIYYSTPEDIAQKAKERAAAIFRWAGWICTPYAQNPRTRIVEYGWSTQGASRNLQLENLRGTPLKGRIQLELAVGAPPGAVDVYLRLPQSAPVTFRRSAGQFQPLETSEMELPADGLNLQMGVSGARAASVQGILIRDAQFVQAGEQP
jgi:4-amino-4-deoxy-L-arabinose transferase-like glycosyltransferase